MPKQIQNTKKKEEHRKERKLSRPVPQKEFFQEKA